MEDFLAPRFYPGFPLENFSMSVLWLKQRGISIPSESAGGSQPRWAPEIQISHFTIGETGLAPNDPLLFKFRLIPLPAFPLFQQSKSDFMCLGHHLANEDFPNPEQRALFRVWECWALCFWATNSWSCTQNPPGNDNRKGILDVTLRSGCNVHPWGDVPATTKLFQEMLCL